MAEETTLNDLISEMNRQVVFDDKQVEAIRACCDVDRRLVPVTGPAGTGKTLIIKETEKRLSNDGGYLVGVSAPTGKAARRIKELTGIDAMTNHRLLGYGMPYEKEVTDENTGEKTHIAYSTGPRFTRTNPLPYDVIICDEYAMVNNEIHRNLVDALKPGARMCVFGDVNQLRPIEEDPTMKDKPSNFMTLLANFNGVFLETNHRQGKGSGIAENGRRVLRGSIPVRHDDFSVLYTTDTVNVLRKFILDQRELGRDYASTNCQVLTVMNKTWIGTTRLNASIQAIYWDRNKPYMALPRHKQFGKEAEPDIRVQVGTKVVYTTNTYDIGDDQGPVFNGEVGIVDSIDPDSHCLDIDFGDRVIRVPPLIIIVRDDGRVTEQDPRKNIALAYALTTHKMQGSECACVCYVIGRSTQFMQSRRNLYTGITRAKEHCTIIADQVSIMKSTRFEG